MPDLGEGRKMREDRQDQMSRRERQIMDIIHRRGQATAQEVMEELPDAPGYSAVRALLRLMEEKGYLRHQKDGQRYLYRATQAREKARNSALRNLLRTFFEDSAGEAVAALLDLSASKLSKEDLDRLSQMIEKAREDGR
jgi:BlaI family transcriptional regulator, penicillinase repressor